MKKMSRLMAFAIVGMLGVSSVQALTVKERWAKTKEWAKKHKGALIGAGVGALTVATAAVLASPAQNFALVAKLARERSRNADSTPADLQAAITFLNKRPSYSQAMLIFQAAKAGGSEPKQVLADIYQRANVKPPVWIKLLGEDDNTYELYLKRQLSPNDEAAIESSLFFG